MRQRPSPASTNCHCCHDACDIQILTLGANGVGLAVQLLRQEIQLAAHGLVQLQDIAVLRNVAAQTDSLLIHGGLIAKDGSLGQHTGIIRVTAEALKIEPIIVAPVMALPMLLILLIGMLLSTRKRKKTRGEEHEKH